ncbi:MAG TPA: hypothetical protein VMM59_11165 [Thermohalobaculum sp.]|nr:hypothetical protein [Thermohalobaculum sp.]
MSESLLSFSEVLLFGRKVEDLQIVIAEADSVQAAADQKVSVTTTRNLVDGLAGHQVVDGVLVTTGSKVLVRHHGVTNNGIYTVGAAGVAWVKSTAAKDTTVLVEEGDRFNGSVWKQILSQAGRQQFAHVRGSGRGQGWNSELDDQLGEGACLARIYGFSYEGMFYQLPAPTIFVVHGDGTSVTDSNEPQGHFARAPLNPSKTGVAAADFQFSDDIMYWSYDKADYSIRMDVMTGQLEEILLDVFFELEAPMLAGGRVAGGRVAGGRVAGGRVAGGRVAGGRVAGGRVAGGRVSGGRVSGSDD